MCSTIFMYNTTLVFWKFWQKVQEYKNIKNKINVFLYCIYVYIYMPPIILESRTSSEERFFHGFGHFWKKKVSLGAYHQSILEEEMEKQIVKSTHRIYNWCRVPIISQSKNCFYDQTKCNTFLFPYKKNQQLLDP